MVSTGDLESHIAPKSSHHSPTQPMIRAKTSHYYRPSSRTSPCTECRQGSDLLRPVKTWEHEQATMTTSLSLSLSLSLFLCLHIYECTHVYVHMRFYMYICAYIYIYTQPNTSLCMYICLEKAYLRNRKVKVWDMGRRNICMKRMRVFQGSYITLLQHEPCLLPRIRRS